MARPKAVALLSGGMDSTTLAYFLASEGYQLYLLSVHYGQRHARELEYAARTAVALGAAEHKVLDLSVLRELLRGSALTDRVKVPHGHYSAASMAATVVPNRNMILLSIAAGWAGALQADTVATAVHHGDHAVYPDCRPEFAEAVSEAIQEAFSPEINGIAPRLYTPFIYRSKAEICAQGHQLGVRWEDTWSCYEGGEVHCGRCGTDCERIEAFLLAGVPDPTEYADKEYALEVLRQRYAEEGKEWRWG